MEIVWGDSLWSLVSVKTIQWYSCSTLTVSHTGHNDKFSTILDCFRATPRQRSHASLRALPMPTPNTTSPAARICQGLRRIQSEPRLEATVASAGLRNTAQTVPNARLALACNQGSLSSRSWREPASPCWSKSNAISETRSKWANPPSANRLAVCRRQTQQSSLTCPRRDWGCQSSFPLRVLWPWLLPFRKPRGRGGRSCRGRRSTGASRSFRPCGRFCISGLLRRQRMPRGARVPATKICDTHVCGVGCGQSATSARTLLAGATTPNHARFRSREWTGAACPRTSPR